MHVDLNATTVSEYGEQHGRVIDYDCKVSTVDVISNNEAELIQRILTCEVSIYCLRRITGACGSNVDTMGEMRSELIKKYNATYNFPFDSPNGTNFL